MGKHSGPIYRVRGGVRDKYHNVTVCTISNALIGFSSTNLRHNPAIAA